jgi:hypothetical protein
MNLGFGHPEGVGPPVWIEATEFAEVVYRSNDVLVISVATDLAEDLLLAGALMDVIAAADECDSAESAIATLASELDLDVRSGHTHGEHHLTILPSAPAAAEAGAAVRQPAPGSDGHTVRT